MADRHTRFLYWQRVLCFMHYASAGALAVALAYEGDWEVPVVLRYNVWRGRGDDAESCDGGCRIYEYETIVSTLRVGVLVCMFSVVSGTHHLIAGIGPIAWLGNASLLGTIESSENARGVNVVRWLDYGVSASLMLAVNSILWLAPPTVHQIVNTAAVMAAVVAAGYGSEAAWAAGSKGHPIAIFCAACVPFAMTWASTFTQYHASSSGPAAGDYSLRGGRVAEASDAADPPAFVTIILVVLAATYCTFPIAHAYRLSTDPAKCDVVWIEVVYGILSFTAKIPLLAVYGTAVVTRAAIVDVATNTPTPENTPADDADMKVYAALYASTGASLILAVAMWATMRDPDKVVMIELKPRHTIKARLINAGGAPEEAIAEHKF